MEKPLVVPDSQDSGKNDDETQPFDTGGFYEPTLQLESNADTVKLEEVVEAVDNSETQELDDGSSPSKQEEVSSQKKTQGTSLMLYSSPASIRVASMRKYAARVRTEVREHEAEVNGHRGNGNFTRTTTPKQLEGCKEDVQDERHATKELLALSRCVEAENGLVCASEDQVDDLGMGPNTQMAAETMQFISRGDEFQTRPERKLAKPARVMRKRTSKTSTDVEAPEANDAKRRRVSVKHSVLFSHGLPDSVVKKQEKFLQKLGGEVANSVSDCTHFVSGASFTRSVNMLEAMAAGKPVVTTAWLESSNVAGCFLNENKYILQDSKKERELGFSMSSTLAAAQRRLLLQGYKVHVTSHTRPPSKDVISIVKAAGGKVTGSRAKDLAFVISSEEDSKLCSTFISRGIKVYSTELLLHGVVAYKLDFSKFQLFK